MKEFKFRAWDKRTNIMLSWGNLLHRYNSLDCLSFSFLDIMQFSGLKDKNGKEIYDGDILRADIAGSIRIVKVVYKNGAFYIENIPHVQEQMFNTFPIGMCKPVYEVIGNIYDNPEMLTDEV